MGPPLMKTAEVASFFRVSPATIAYWRQIGYGPKGRKVGRHVLYERSEVEAFWDTLKDGTGGAPVLLAADVPPQGLPQ